MRLSQLIPVTKNKKGRRLGRGSGSGRGKTSGRGNKGAGQRSGKRLPYVGFAGGNLPLARRILKRGFKSLRANPYQIVNLKDIAAGLKDVKEVSAKVLYENHLIKDSTKPIKILGDIKGNFPFKTTFKVNAYSAKAKQIIAQSGSTIGVLEVPKKEQT